MLVLKAEIGEQIFIADGQIVIEVCEIPNKFSARFGITAPQSIPIVRGSARRKNARPRDTETHGGTTCKLMLRDGRGGERA